MNTLLGNSSTRVNSAGAKEVYAYLVSRYARREELQQYAEYFMKERDWAITSRWLFEDHTVVDDTPEPERTELRRRYALEDRDDLLASNLVVVFTEEEHSGFGRGGRHWEHGFVSAMMTVNPRLQLVIVGPKENVFHCLPISTYFADVDAFFRAEAEMPKGVWLPDDTPRAVMADRFRTARAIHNAIDLLNASINYARELDLRVDISVDSIDARTVANPNSSSILQLRAEVLKRLEPQGDNDQYRRQN